MTERIVDYLSALVSTVGDIDTVHCLAERRTINDADNNKTEIPYVYATGGNYRPVEVDGGSVSYWRLGSPISMTEGEGFSVPKPLSATYPLRFFAIVNRDNINPLTYSQDVANVLQQENSTDLRTQLGAKRVKITVNAVETETSKLWREEFKVPVEDLHYTRAMIAIDVTINVVANRECWVNCDTYPDILQGFPWCSETEATIDRLTPEQIACVENYLCEIVPCADATVQLNGTTVGTIASGATGDFPVNLDGSPSGVWDGTAWQVTSTPCADATVELNGVEMTTIPSGDTENISIRQSSGATEVGSKQGTHWRIDDSAISINGSPVSDVKAEDALDIDVTQDGSPVGSWNGSSWIVPPATGATLSIEVYSDAGYSVPTTSLTYGATAYIKLTPTGITPTTHTLFFGNGTKNAPQVELIGTNQYAWVVSLTGTITISATATDGTDATADATPFTLTSTLAITNGLVFDGVNDYAIFTPRINSSDNFSVTMWIKLLSISGGETVFTIGNMVNSGIAPFLFGYYNDKWEVLSDPGWNFSDGYAWTRDTNRHHVTLTRSESTNEQLFYLDGVYAANLGSYNLVGLFDKFIIGFNNGMGVYGNMEISDFAIHNTVLTPTEITAMQTLGVTSGHEVQRFPFTESVGTTSGYITDIINGDQMIIRNMTSGFGVQIRS